MPDDHRRGIEPVPSPGWLWRWRSEWFTGKPSGWSFTDDPKMAETAALDTYKNIYEVVEVVSVSTVSSLRTELEEAERDLRLATKEMGHMVNTIERLRLSSSVSAVKARDECLRLSGAQLQAATLRVTEIEGQMREVVAAAYRFYVAAGYRFFAAQDVPEDDIDEYSAAENALLKLLHHQRTTLAAQGESDG